MFVLRVLLIAAFVVLPFPSISCDRSKSDDNGDEGVTPLDDNADASLSPRALVRQVTASRGIFPGYGGIGFGLGGLGYGGLGYGLGGLGFGLGGLGFGLNRFGLGYGLGGFGLFDENKDDSSSSDKEMDVPAQDFYGSRVIRLPHHVIQRLKAQGAIDSNTGFSGSDRKVILRVPHRLFMKLLRHTEVIDNEAELNAQPDSASGNRLIAVRVPHSFFNQIRNQDTHEPSSSAV